MNKASTTVGARIGRENFDSHWLGAVNPTSTSKWACLKPLVERDGIRDQIRQPLADAVLEHHIHRARVADRLTRLGYARTADWIRQQLPTDDRTRKGNFGEVVWSEHLCQRYGYRMPVFKLRYRDNPELPMRGEDIVAFKMTSSQIDAVVIGEAKTVHKFAAQTVLTAHERLMTAYNPSPMTLSMLAEILYGMEKTALAEQVESVSDRLAEGSFPREYWIFLINEVQPPAPFACLDALPAVVSPLHCVSLPLADFNAFINSVFDSCRPPEAAADAGA
jgi:hypothetical protein